MGEVCAICEGAGMRLVERADGSRVAQRCACQVAERTGRMVAAAKIPQRYAHCTLEDFEPNYAGRSDAQSGSLVTALLAAHAFVGGYPRETEGNGLLFVGPIGCGKTHLAVGILKELVVTKGVRGLFYDYRDLLKEIQNSYGRNEQSERQILAPVFEADVLVLDELGAAKPTEWVWDTVQHILNTRYNDRRTTIITTNYPNERETAVGQFDGLPEDKRKAKQAMQRDTLGDRITERMRSRLQEMCVVVPMAGEDFRAKVKRASFPELRAF